MVNESARADMEALRRENRRLAAALAELRAEGAAAAEAGALRAQLSKYVRPSQPVR